MLIAVIGGAQGDVHALDAALSRVDSLGIHTVLCTGNLAAGGDDGPVAQPTSAAATVATRPAPITNCFFMMFPSGPV